MRLPAARAGGDWIARQALRRGLLGSSRIWFAAFVAGSTLKVLRRVLGPRPGAPAFSQRLEPGAALKIRHLRGRANRP